MDRTDIRILRELLQAHTVWPGHPGIIASYRQVARALHANPGTIRNRIARMIRSGFLQGIACYLNPAVLGLQSCSYAVEIAAGRSKPEVLRRVADVEGVVFLEVFRGPLLGVGIAYDSERSMRSILAKVDRIAGSAPGLWTAVAHPPTKGTLSRGDWALAFRLVSGSFVSYTQLAHELGIPVRTLRRRLTRLEESGALLSFPRMDFRALTGSIAAELLVGLPDPAQRVEAESRILVRVQDWAIFVGAWETFNIYRLFLPRVSLASELAEEVARIPGVQFARAEFVEGLEDHLEKLQVYAERALARRGVRRTRTPPPALAARLPSAR